MERTRWIRWLLAIGATSLVLASVGCGVLGPGGGGNADIRQVVDQWASALQTGSEQGLTANYAPTYSYDGAVGGQTAPAPYFWGFGGGTFSHEIISVEQDGDHAVVRVRITFVGFIGPDTLPPPPELTEEQDRLNSPGFGAPSVGTAPGEDPESSGSTGGTATGAHAMMSIREVAARQTAPVPITFTAILRLELQQINGAWLIIAQRQEASTTLIGNGARAPVIATLLLNGSETPTVQPAADATVSGTVQDTSEQAVLARLGYRIAAIPVTGENFSGPMRTPRRQGRYVLEVEAVNFNPESRAAGFSSRSIEVIVEGNAGDFTFSVAPSVELDPAAQAVLEGYIRAIHEYDPRTARSYVADDYSYNGLNAEVVSYFVEGLSGFPESVLAVTVTAAASEGSLYRAIVQTSQVSEMGGWVEPVQGGTGGGGTVNGGTGTTPGGVMSREIQAQVRQNMGQELHQDSVLEFELINPAAWRISAIRPDAIAVYSDGATPATLSNVLVNGQDSVSVEGRAALSVTGQVSGVGELGHHAYAFIVDSWTQLDISTGSFEGALQAPRNVGRWVLTVGVDSQSETGFSHVTAGREVAVTSPAAVATFVVAPGVEVPEAALALLNYWLSTQVNGDYPSWQTLYSQAYNYDGLDFSRVTSIARLWLFDAVFDRAELVEAAPLDLGGVRVHGVLSFLGPLQFYPYPGGGGGEPRPVPLDGTLADGSVRQVGGGARNLAAITWELTPRAEAGATGFEIRLERLNRAGSATGDLHPFEIGDINVNESAATTSVPLGSAVFVGARVDAPDGTPAHIRLGPSQIFGLQVTGGRVGTRLIAPGEPGRYAAEIVVLTGENMIMDSSDPTRPDIWPPPPMAVSLRAREIHVTR